MVMKRPAAPKTLPIARKTGGRFITEPKPGPHSKSECMSLSIVVKSLMGIADSTTEAKSLIKTGRVMIDGKSRKDHRFATGIFDLVTVADDSYRIVPTESGFTITDIDKKENAQKLCKIVNKKALKGGKVQLNLNDGKNILVDKDTYATGDSVIVSLPELKIVKHIPRKEGVQCMITRGKNRSKIGTLKNVDVVRGSGPNMGIISLGDREVRVPEEILFVVGEKSPEITVIK